LAAGPSGISAPRVYLISPRAGDRQEVANAIKVGKLRRMEQEVSELVCFLGRECELGVGTELGKHPLLVELGRRGYL
jgi:hypothetical protein